MAKWYGFDKDGNWEEVEGELVVDYGDGRVVPFNGGLSNAEIPEIEKGLRAHLSSLFEVSMGKTLDEYLEELKPND